MTMALSFVRLSVVDQEITALPLVMKLKVTSDGLRACV